MAPSKRYPAFIKPYFPPDTRKSLKLPPPFTSFVKGTLPDKVLLKDNFDGNVWAVEVEKFGSELFFQAGWTKFLEDNSSEFGDFLVFQYNGGGLFSFKILRKTAKIIDITRAMDFSSNERPQEDEETEEAVKEQTGNNEKSESLEGENLVEELEEEILIKNLRKKRGRTSGARTRKLGESSNATMANVAAEDGEAQGKATAVQSDDDQDLKSYVGGLQNPHFLIKYKKYKENQVYVPVDFVLAYGDKLLPEMIIRDPIGREWPISFCFRRDKTMWMLGWRLLAQINNLEADDFLVCELVQSRNTESCYIQLHIHQMKSRVN